VLDLDTTKRDRNALVRTVEEIARRVKLDTLVVHPTKYGLAVHAGQMAETEGPFDPNPKITTGAGDHFNAGFCLGKLLGLDLACSLLAGVATSGYYVRHARSPSVPDLAQMLQSWT
jgi:sugar/nucleoside kinase (ribokinase family)